jgi:hypothetical protein
MRRSGFVISGLGIIGSLVMSLPMPWRIRMGIASILGRVMGWALTHNASIYRYVIDRNREFGMGKQQPGEMQSIHALQRVIKEIERRQIVLGLLKNAVRDAKADNISMVELPRYLGHRFFGVDETAQLLKNLPGY